MLLYSYLRHLFQLLLIIFFIRDSFPFSVKWPIRIQVANDHSLHLHAFPSFHWPISIFPSVKKSPAIRFVNDSLSSITIREVSSREELRVCCNLCVDAFFGGERSLLHDWKLQRIRSELKDLLLFRYENSKNFRDNYILAESTQLKDYVVSRPLPLWPGYEPDTVIVGFALLSMVPANDKSFSHVEWPEKYAVNLTVIAKITNLSVDRGCRGLGIGMSLLEACGNHARLHGLNFVVLEVEADNAVAIKLYKKAGFEEVCTQYITMYDIRSLFLRNIRKKSIVMMKSLIPISELPLQSNKSAINDSGSDDQIFS
jgi:ribosomal protein S18 acetylase RimI-like enzyme